MRWLRLVNLTTCHGCKWSCPIIPSGANIIGMKEPVFCKATGEVEDAFVQRQCGAKFA